MVVLAAYKVVRLTSLYWLALWRFLRGETYDAVNLFGSDTWAKVQVYSLSLIFFMWDKPHYRSATFQEDMVNNLRNVAVPGTGIPLSVFCCNYYLCLCFVFFLNPLICLLGAVNKCRKDKSLSYWRSFSDHLAGHYEQHLLHPDDWFSFWRLNCRLTSAQSLLTQTPGFEFENKWKFLLDGHRAGVPVSPFLDASELVCKHKNIEGGMGIYFFKNALAGGDWIIQERLGNAGWLNELLPGNAPLSTMRVITASTFALSAGVAAADKAHAAASKEMEIPSPTLAGLANAYVTPSTAVLRLGRANASTDHSSVLFDVDKSTGRIGKGLDNSHWYRLGLNHIISCPWLPLAETHTKHPDPPNVTVLGKVVPNMKDALDICVQSHFKLMPDVPMVGWDVAFTDKGLFLLEVNLSCNFFKGTFDIPDYISFVDKHWKLLDREMHVRKAAGDNKKAK